nr:polysaccharide pyruvyl transferase family protein [Alloalcanivorax xenomutans]
MGDDALVIACCSLLESCKGDVFLHDPRNSYLPDFVSKEIGRQYIRWKGKLADADAVVYGGGTLFYSYSEAGINKKFGWGRRIIRGVQHPKAAYQFIMSWIDARKRRRRRKTTIMLGVGFGPFHGNELQKRRALDLVNSCSDVVVRDSASGSICHGSDTRVTEAHDLCLIPRFFNRLYPSIGNGKKEGIIIIPRDWEREIKGKSIGEGLKQVVENYAMEGGKIKLVFFSKKEDEKWKCFAKKLKDRFGERQVKIIEWEPEVGSIADFLTCLEDGEAIISMRYHGVIFSMLKGLSVYSVPIDNKLIYLSEKYSVPLWTGDENLRNVSYDVSMIRKKIERAVLENEKLLCDIVVRNFSL